MRLVAICLSSILILANGPALSDQIGDTSDAIKEELKLFDIWIRSKMVDREQPGLSIGVVHNGELIWDKSYGFSDVDDSVPATSEALYRIASISKTFTATAILQLRDAGELELTDPIQDHLPWFQLDGEHSLPIRIWHLLTHTSGLPREPVGLNWSDLTMPSRVAMIDRIGQQQPVFAPETEWKYSNLAFALAGEIVAAVSGQSWEEYIQENILDPLKMASTVVAPARSQSMLATGYQRRALGEPRETRPWIDTAAVRPAANLASNVEDLARYVAFHLSDGDHVLSAASRSEMQRVHWLLKSWDQGWGLGFRIVRKADYDLVGHGGLLPGHRTDIAFAPKYELGIVVLTNATDGAPTAYSDMAFDLLIPAIQQSEMVGIDEIDSELSRYVGTYSDANGEITVLIYKGGLAAVEHNLANPAKSLIKLQPVGEHSFEARLTAMHYWANGQVFRFIIGDEGQAVEMRTDFLVHKRVDKP